MFWMLCFNLHAWSTEKDMGSNKQKVSAHWIHWRVQSLLHTSPCDGKNIEGKRCHIFWRSEIKFKRREITYIDNKIRGIPNTNSTVQARCSPIKTKTECWNLWRLIQWTSRGGATFRGMRWCPSDGRSYKHPGKLHTWKEKVPQRHRQYKQFPDLVQYVVVCESVKSEPSDFKRSSRKQQMQKLRKGNLRWFRFLKEKSDMYPSEITGGIKKGLLLFYCIHPFSHKCDIGHYIYKLHYILNI